MNNGEVDFFYGISTKIEHDMQAHHYPNVVPNTLVNDRNDICFGVTRPVDGELLPILNKSVNSDQACGCGISLPGVRTCPKTRVIGKRQRAD